MFAKFIDGALQYAPFNYKTDDGQIIVNFNKSEIIMKQYGFKEVVDVKPVYDEETQYIVVVDYIDNEDSIVINYEVVDKPTVELVATLEERVATIEKQVSDQSIILSEEVNKVE